MYSSTWESRAKRNRYKSEPERQIAAFLMQSRIPFIYEKPTAVIDESHTKIWYPDFTLSCGIIVEYFGVQNNRDYTESIKHKLKVYHENQFQIIPLYPSDLRPSWTAGLISRIGYTLENRLTMFREATRQNPPE